MTIGQEVALALILRGLIAFVIANILALLLIWFIMFEITWWGEWSVQDRGMYLFGTTPLTLFVLAGMLTAESTD